MAFSRCFLLVLSLFASSAVLASPHGPRNALHHRALVHRAPIPIPSPLDAPLKPLRRRQSGHCKQRTSSSSVVVAPTAAVANAAPDPSTTTTSSVPATTSSAPADTPAPTPEAAAPTTTSSTPAPQDTTTTAAAAATTSASGDASRPYLSNPQMGQGTYYGTGMGACGIVNSDSDKIVAVSKLLFDTYPGYAGPGSNPNNNPVCNKAIRAFYQGKSVDVIVTDRCEACAVSDLDFSPSAFSEIADQALGRINISWQWL